MYTMKLQIARGPNCYILTYIHSFFLLLTLTQYSVIHMKLYRLSLQTYFPWTFFPTRYCTLQQISPASGMAGQPAAVATATGGASRSSVSTGGGSPVITAAKGPAKATAEVDMSEPESRRAAVLFEEGLLSWHALRPPSPHALRVSRCVHL